jgi:hypothetical protein
VKGIENYPQESFKDLKEILKRYGVKRFRIPTF